MRVCKFGGTCVTDINIAKIASIVDNTCAVVVVSAVGAQHANDTKVTQLLHRMHSMLPDISLWAVIASKYKAIVYKHHIDIDIDSLLDITIADIVRYNSYHYTMSVGEQLSARVVARYLHRQYIEAEQVVLFDKCHNLLLDDTCDAILQRVDAGQQYVMGGFYGGIVGGGRMTFSRGGSDISGAIVARALCVDIYENWTDVCGLCHCDPRLIDCVGSVRCLSYDNMQLLADSGVCVLNNHSIYPVKDAGIPINIRSIYNISDSGTVVSADSVSQQLLSMLEAIDEGRYVTTVISTYEGIYIVGAVATCATSLNIDCRTEICSKNIVKVYSDTSILKPLYRQLVD